LPAGGQRFHHCRCHGATHCHCGLPLRLTPDLGRLYCYVGHGEHERETPEMRKRREKFIKELRSFARLVLPLKLAAPYEAR